MELQDYLKIRDDSKLSKEDLISLKDDYIDYYKANIKRYLHDYYYYLAQFILCQEEFSYKSLCFMYEYIWILVYKIKSEIDLFASSKEIYEYLKIDEIIAYEYETSRFSFIAYEESKYDNTKYLDDYDKCKYLFKNQDDILEIMHNICRTDLAKKILDERE